nr:ribonuclease H-like domain-containing protein [Tanacetum cinerariifolium]
MFLQEDMDSDSAYMVATSKVPMLKPGEYELWRMRIEQYIYMIDYSLWEVIENGNAPPITQVVEGVETIIAPTTAKEKAQRRNKLEIDTLILDDLYNNLKIYESEVKGTSSSNTNTQNVAFVSSNSTSNTNRAVNTAHDATTASTQATAVNLTTIDNLSDAVICAFFTIQPNNPQLNNGDLQQIHPDDLKEMDLRWQMSMLTIRARRFLKNTGMKFSMNGNETIRAPRSQDTKHKESTRSIVPVETPVSTALFVNEPIVSKPTFKKPIVETSEAKASADKPNVVRKNFGSPFIKDWISDSEDEAESKPKIEKKTGNPQINLHDKGVIDSGCSRHMIRNMSYLTDYKEIDGGYVTFGGKFNGMANKGFFGGYSLNSKAFRVFNSRTRIVKENLHIRFSENTPNIVGSGPDWLFDIDALTRIMNYEPIAAGTQSNGFAGTKSSQDDRFQPSSDSRKKVDEDPSKGSECRDQEKDDNVNSINNDNAASINRCNTISENISNDLLFDPDTLAMEDISTFNFSSDHEDDDEEADTIWIQQSKSVLFPLQEFLKIILLIK